MSELRHPEFTDSEDESVSTTIVHSRYEDKQQPDKSSAAVSAASTPASVETPSQQNSSLRDSDATLTLDTAQDNVPALVLQQHGCDALGHSFAKLVSSLTDALNACCGTSPPPAQPDRNADPGGKNAEARSSSKATEPQKRDSEESAAGETAKKESDGDSAKSRNFLDDLAMDHRSPSELLQIEQREKVEEELDEKLLQYQMLRQAGELSNFTELEHLEKEKEELLSSPLSVFSPQPKEEEDAIDDEKFAVHLVHVSPDERTTPVATDEQATQPSNGEPASEDAPPPQPPDAAGSTSPATSAAQQDGARERDAEEVATDPNRDGLPGDEELGHGEGLEDGHKDDKQEVHVEEGVDAAEEAGAVGDASAVAPSYLPPDVVQKIPDLPKDSAGAVASPESGQAPPRQAPAVGTQDTELVFRYKTRVGFTVTLLFLASVVVFTVAIGQFTARSGQPESLREATTLLSFPEWNKSDNSRAQLMIPEEETERDFLTLDVN